MLSIEEIKLLIEKLEKAKESDLQQLIDTNLKILKDIETAVDANNEAVIDRLDKTPEWFTKDRPWHRNVFKGIYSMAFELLRGCQYMGGKEH